jgi:hypothetical protein
MHTCIKQERQETINLVLFQSSSDFPAIESGCWNHVRVWAVHGLKHFYAESAVVPSRRYMQGPGSSHSVMHWPGSVEVCKVPIQELLWPNKRLFFSGNSHGPGRNRRIIHTAGWYCSDINAPCRLVIVPLCPRDVWTVFDTVQASEGPRAVLPDTKGVKGAFAFWLSWEN